MRLQLIAAAALTAALLAACGPKPEAARSDAASTSTPATVPGAAEPVAAINQAFAVEPGSMSDCNPVVAKVSWDVRAAHPTVSDIEIYVGPDSAPTLFAAGGAFGDTDTAQWAAPGATFHLRDKATGEELERATITGPSCG